MVELPGLHPLEHKLLTGDVFTYNKGKVELVHSSLRLSDSISAVLILTNNKTYGSKKGKLLYKCIPDDNHLPIFLIPYDIKIGFSKVIKNKYVVFQFDNRAITLLFKNLANSDVSCLVMKSVHLIFWVKCLRELINSLMATQTSQNE